MSSIKPVYVIEIYPWNRDTEENEVVRVSFGEYATEPTDATLPNVRWIPAVVEPVTFKRFAFNGSQILFGISIAERGFLTVANGVDPITGVAPFDYLLTDDYEWKNARVIVRFGTASTAYAALETKLEGFVADDPEVGSDRLRFPLRTTAQLLSEPFPFALFAGTNSGATGVEGDEDDEGKTKPVPVGMVNDQLVAWANKVNLILQFGDPDYGPYEAVTGVRDNGIALVSDGDLTGSAFLTWSKVPGHFVTDLANGMVMLGAIPFGEVRMDIKGIKGQSLGSGSATWLSSHAQLIYWLCDQAGVANIDTVAFEAHHSADSHPAGIFLDGSVTYAEVISRMLPGCGSYMGDSRAGDLGLFQLNAPASTADFEVPDAFIETLARGRRTGPYHRVRVAFGALGVLPDQVLTTGNPVGDVSDVPTGDPLIGTSSGPVSGAISDVRMRLDRSSEVYFPPLKDDGAGAAIVNTSDAPPPSRVRIGRHEDAAVMTSYPNSATEPPVTQSYYATRAGAEYQSERLTQIFATPRHFWQVSHFVPQSAETATVDFADMVIGKTGEIFYPRWLTGGSKKLVLVGIDESGESPQYSLGYWG